MRKAFLFLTLLTSLSSCQLNWYGDIDLGSDFYYMVEPAFNSIVIPVNPDEPYKSSINIIKDIESVGYNKNYILATSKSGDEIKYWQIDKKAESKELGYKDNSIMELSNVSQIKSAEFDKIKKSENIKLKNKTEYRKELNYE
ncbi:hypothetical protein BZARG_3101 [Bizionia argentinensis JUB59]|uniref:DUF3997 domain-containing protein n=1 Tax=Bizionia argentinensis JUB59 TaxID=1046627 RepID=G2EE14_9FLAO|nr:hypothetical protein [Bizionia argentinensis]EGV43321.2 hypothetical protein BZARG_3101 [Bizionia argentinensis JUB59]